MMIATYISGTTHLMRAARGRHYSFESSPIQEAQQCADHMTEMSTTFTIAARQADLLQTAIERYISDGGGDAAVVRQPVSIDTSKPIPQNVVDLRIRDTMTEVGSSTPTLASRSSELTTLRQSWDCTLDLLLAAPNLNSPVAEEREAEMVLEETAQIQSQGSEPNLWLWDFQSSVSDRPTTSGGIDGVATGVDGPSNSVDWDSDVFGL
jgi:hypothetical protein